MHKQGRSWLPGVAQSPSKRRSRPQSSYPPVNLRPGSWYLSSRSEHQLQRLLFLGWENVPIPLHHLFRLMTDPGVDEPLVDPLGRTGGAKGMPQHVPATQHPPLAAGQGTLEVVAGLVAGDRRDYLSLLLAAKDVAILDEQERSTGVDGQPLAQHLREANGQRHAPASPAFPDALCQQLLELGRAAVAGQVQVPEGTAQAPPLPPAEQASTQDQWGGSA